MENLKLYDVIIHEFSEDETIKNFAQLLTCDPVEAGISESDFRSRFRETVGYDPTTMYDFKRIDDAVDSTTAIDHLVDDVDEFKSTIRRKYLDSKDEHISNLINNELANIDDDEEYEFEEDNEESSEDDDDFDSRDFDDIEYTEEE